MSPLFGVLRKETEYFSLRGEETSEPETWLTRMEKVGWGLCVVLEEDPAVSLKKEPPSDPLFYRSE